MSEFNRENRYLVLKIKDISEALNSQQISDLNHCVSAVNGCRQRKGKGPLQAVVVESDWPIYEYVWGLIESMSADHFPYTTEMVPGGLWQLVPMEPTEEMVNSGHAAWSDGEDDFQSFAMAYGAMLAAAPKLEGGAE